MVTVTVTVMVTRYIHFSNNKRGVGTQEPWRITDQHCEVWALAVQSRLVCEQRVAHAVQRACKISQKPSGFLHAEQDIFVWDV